MIEKVLKAKIGLNYDSIGRKNVETAISRHMKKHGVNCEKDYLELIAKSDNHFEELIQSVLVPETWFFRYSESFVFLAQYAQKYLAGRHHQLQILSLPCSSGEEPYSIAITLLDSGVPATLIHIDAADVSSHVLKKAEQAVYGPNSFRSGVSENLNRFFLVKGEKREVIQPVKDLINFQKISIFDQNFLAGRQQYDLIFCRNLLIYFSPEEQAKTIATLAGILKENGTIFLGHSESGIINRRDFESVNFPSSFAFRKKGSNEIPPAETTKYEAPKPKPLPAIPKILHKTRRIGVASATPDTPHESKDDDMLKKAAALADRGILQEAEILCRQYLEHNKLNPAAYYTLGVVYLSSNRLTEAELAFNRAVYLNPGHYEALVHLALLKERRGEPGEALKLKKRAEKSVTASKS